MDFLARLRAAAQANRSWVCVGLDPDSARMPGLGDADSVLRFNRSVIESTQDLVCAYKVNSAYYEALGSRGFEVMRKTRESVPEGIPVILDAKRGDVPHTAERYAAAAFDQLGYDAITAQPYLGLDALVPFLVRPDRGCFVLVRTTNPSAAEIQDTKVSGEPLYVHLAGKVAEWSRQYPNLGVVAGATVTAELGEVRRTIGEDLPILVPGVGAQGGDATEAARAGGNARGELAIVTASRSVIYAGSPENVRAACLRLREDVARGAPGGLAS